jgi:hypothetical protein
MDVDYNMVYIVVIVKMRGLTSGPATERPRSQRLNLTELAVVQY